MPHPVLTQHSMDLVSSNSYYDTDISKQNPKVSDFWKNQIERIRTYVASFFARRNHKILEPNKIESHSKLDFELGNDTLKQLKAILGTTIDTETKCRGYKTTAWIQIIHSAITFETITSPTAERQIDHVSAIVVRVKHSS